MAELVSSGGFRVDRARALEKLSAFQLDDAHKALLALIRSAAASGATWVRIARKPRLTVSFDGRPLTSAELEDPFAALFTDESHGDVRSRQLALGVLALLPAAGELELTGGSGPARRRLVVPNPASFTATELKNEPDTRTLLRFSLGAPRSLGDASRLSSDCWACRIPIYLDDRALPRGLAPDYPGVAFDEKGRYGWVAVPKDPAKASRLALHVLGTRIVDGEFALNVPLTGYVNDDAFALDASQAKVVRNEVFDSVAASLERVSDRLLAETIERLPRELRVTERLLSSALYRKAWREALETPDRTPLEDRLGGSLFLALQRLFGADAEGIRDRLRLQRWQAAALRWLRHLAGVESHRLRANAALSGIEKVAPRTVAAP